MWYLFIFSKLSDFLIFQYQLVSITLTTMYMYVAVPDGGIRTKYQIASLVYIFSIFVPIFKVHYIDTFYNYFHNV